MRTIVAATAACTLLGFTSALADEAEIGELWEMTAQASIPGMSMPMKPFTTKVCQKAEWTNPPQTDPNAGDNCKTSDVVRAGDKLSWKMACASPPMTGEGEIRFQGSDAYEGEFTMQTGKYAMRMALTGKKLGACDNPQ